MSTHSFGAYARYYNLLYHDKDYTAEAAFIDGLIARYACGPTKQLRLLDMGCGTGRHLLALADLGYTDLSGNDVSADMISIARQDANAAKRNISYYNHFFQEAFRIPGKFDVVTALFSAVNYIVNCKEQLQSFGIIHSLLNPGGLFLFDYWNGHAVVRDYSPVRVLQKQQNGTEIIRISRTGLDLVQQQATVQFTGYYMEHDRKMMAFEETHRLHYYFFAEMESLLQRTGFTILQRMGFMKPDVPVDPYDWNVCIVAQK